MVKLSDEREERDEREVLDVNMYLGQDLRTVIGRLARELHLQIFQLSPDSGEEVELEVADIKFSVSGSEIPVEAHRWKEQAYLVNLFLTKALDVFQDEAERSAGSPYSLY